MTLEDPTKYQPTRLRPFDFDKLDPKHMSEKFHTHYPNERTKARAIHDFVKDHILYGFTPYIDGASTNYTLHHKIGHAHPKAQVFITLLRACGFEAFPHFYLIRKTLYEGLIPNNVYAKIPDILSHVCTKVKVAGLWCTLDSYVMDDQLIKYAKNKLIKKGWEEGYGVQALSSNFWDGKSNAFSQLTNPTYATEDHGQFETFKSYYRSKHYPHKFLSIRYSTWFKTGFINQINTLVADANYQINRVRNNKKVKGD